ncbi:MAG: hypothetical protein ACRCVT_00245 [Leadbetterella sp.]
MKFKFILILSLIVLFQKQTQAQFHYRFKADVSIKEKLVNGKMRLTMGKVYYDKIYGKIVYKLYFPKKETMVIQDTILYVLDEKTQKLTRSRSALLPEFTMFHLALSGTLEDYGLKSKSTEKGVFEVVKVEKNDKGVVSTWQVKDPKLKKSFGNIELLNKDKKMEAMIFYNPDGEVIGRHFYSNYIVSKGVGVPQEISMELFDENKNRSLQVITYKNIEIDQTEENEIYRYRIPIELLNK